MRHISGSDVRRAPGRPALVLAGLVAVAGALWVAWPRRESPAPPKRIAPAAQGETASTRRPEFVGSQACAACHAEQFASYQQTAHSRAFGDVDPEAEPLGGAFHHELSGRDYEIVRQEGLMRHRESLRNNEGDILAQADHPLRWLVGSGRHSRTYLIETDGFLAESPITWYASRQAWAMSPGYDKPLHQGFERPADWGCLYCHVGRAEPVDGAYHRLSILEPAIGCERCHGPGAEHAARHREGGIPDAAADPIIHPAGLSRARQEDICAQCHLRGESTVALTGRSFDDFQPGMRLSDVRLDYHIQAPGDAMKVVGHVEQMRLSACYLKSDTLTCTTCHEMHAPPQPAEAPGFYRQRCLDCHGERDCGLAHSERIKRNSRDNCVACHMPQVETDIPHIAFTHHRIGIHSASIGPASGAETETGPGVLAAYGDVSHVSLGEQERALGLAYLEAYSKHAGRPEFELYRRRSQELLEISLVRSGKDGEIAAALAKIYWLDDDPRAIDAALAALRDSRTSVSARVNALFVAGELLFRHGRPEAALPHLEDLTRRRRMGEDQLLLAGCRAQLGRFEEAEQAARVALEIDPFRPDAYELLAKIARHRGDASAANQHLKRMEQLSTADRD